MDFTVTMTNATKRSILLRAIGGLEEELWNLCWSEGIDPADLPNPYTKPADSTRNGLTHIEESQVRLYTAVAAYNALPAE